MAWLEVLPRYEGIFRQRGWEAASLFLGWTGILVNKHRHRQVEQVRLTEDFANASGSEGFFLKKEFAVSWRDRFRNAWDGFGWCSTAVREGAMLQALTEAGIGCPEVAALGEDDRRAFVLMRDESAMTELRVYLADAGEEARCRVADALGRELAKMHDAGFDHPDLFAKHILVGADEEATVRFCILDWPRSRRRPSVPWRVRLRDLAVLDATLHAALASDRLRLRCLRAYRSALAKHLDAPPLRRLALRVREEAAVLRARRNIREIGQLPTPTGEQQFVTLQDGRLLMVQSYFEEFGGVVPDWLMQMLASQRGAPRKPRDEVLRIPGIRSTSSLGLLQKSSNWAEIELYSWPAESSSWEIPPLAHTLFRLQRFGVPAPRLVAVGCLDSRIVLVAKSARTIPFAEGLAKATSPQRASVLRHAGSIVRQMHEAGYHLPLGDSWEARLGIVPATGAVALVGVESLPRGTTCWQELAPVELSRSTLRLSRMEKLRFLQSYLQPRQAPLRLRSAARERQAVS